MRFLVIFSFFISLFILFSACESFQDGPLAVENGSADVNKPGEPLVLDKRVKVCKAYFEGCNVCKICWTDGDFDLPDFKNQTFTITSAQVSIVTDQPSACLSGEIFGQTCNATVSDCQLPIVLCWQGEYPEEHPFYDGFSIQIDANENLDDVEAVCVITYVIH